MLEKVWYFVLFSVKKASQRVMEQKGEVLGDPSIGREGRSRSDSTLGGEEVSWSYSPGWGEPTGPLLNPPSDFG